MSKKSNKENNNKDKVNIICTMINTAIAIIKLFL